ncbi:Fc.00g079170.m01.CDS01 [Cosmosporella sp. VM-42]
MEAGAPTTCDLLTVVITTSVTPSAPSSELVSTVLQSFNRHCPSLANCKVIVVFDGFDQVVPKARLKKGCVTPKQARDFALYKQNVKKLVLEQHYRSNEQSIWTRSQAEAEYGSPCNLQNVVTYKVAQAHDKKVTFIDSSRRLGFGLAVRSALRLVETPFVWVQQHDWTLVSDFPIDPLLQIMKASDFDPEVPIKYVCLPAVRMLSYATSPDVVMFPTLKELTSSLKREFSSVAHPDINIPLTPMFFWHDKPHVASTSHYLASVFPTRLAMLRGDFIEDKIGQRARGQMKEGLVSNVLDLCCSVVFSLSQIQYVELLSGSYRVDFSDKRSSKDIVQESMSRR